MKAKQRTSADYQLSESAPSFHIDTIVELEVPGEGDSDVTTYLEFSTKYPSQLREQLRDGIYRGVHEGIAMAGMPLEPSGMTVRIARLRLSPVPNRTNPAQLVPGLVDVVQTQIAETVHTLWTGLAALGEPRSA